MEYKEDYSIANDEALKEFLSLEEQNCSRTFEDYEVARESVNKSVMQSLHDFGIMPKAKVINK